ncbi:MAG: TIGR02391 family protein [Mollicutes bacterium]|nr:MAG: TIGR02391 family protein [Mollicutes bacterium]
MTDNEDIEKYYKKGCFYEAGWEAVKLYIQEVKKISKQTDTNARHIMENSFGKGKNNSKSRISLTSLEDEIDKNIQEGHKLYSIGLIAGFRNPLAHETKEKIKKFLFKEKDFLDILSLISHLFRRLEDRKSPK